MTPHAEGADKLIALYSPIMCNRGALCDPRVPLRYSPCAAAPPVLLKTKPGGAWLSVLQL